VPALTRRRMQDVHQETWLIFYDDIRVGTIAERSGVPLDLDRWGWSLGFYPKWDRPGQIRSGTASTFKLACDAFSLAWQDYQPTCRRRASEAWKHAMWAALRCYRRRPPMVDRAAFAALRSPSRRPSRTSTRRIWIWGGNELFTVGYFVRLRLAQRSKA
jgi:hypothetical protein